MYILKQSIIHNGKIPYNSAQILINIEFFCYLYITIIYKIYYLENFKGGITL